MGLNVSRVTSSPVDQGSDNGPKPLKPPSVCQTCWDGPFAEHLGLFHTPFDYETLNGHPTSGSNGYSYNTSWSQIKSGCDLAEGCAWCGLLLSILEKDGLKITPPPESATLKVTVGRGSDDGTPGNPPLLRVFIDKDELEFYGYVWSAADDHAAQYISSAQNPVLDVGSEQALSLARAAIHECEAGHGEHKRCAALSRMASQSHTYLPTRLVDCTSPESPYLAKSSEEGSGSQYLALSYVWGSGEHQPHRTETRNISDYYAGRMDPELLPQTLRDAIYVTHALGFRFLWVDSLCIIHDSDEDMRLELAQMHLIYRHAYLTIVAASAGSAGDGFLQIRQWPAAHSDVISLPFLCPQSRRLVGSAPSPAECRILQQTGTVYVSPAFVSSDKGYVHIEQHRERYHFGVEPISKRGWCLQESQLSARALVFTSESLQFKCQVATKDVCNTLYRPRPDEPLRLPVALLLGNSQPIEHGTPAWDGMHDAWRRFVEDYSQRDVSNPSDKLVACSAMAEAFRPILGPEYCAGLWRDSLLLDMLWERPLAGSLVRVREYRAPSWSWAAVDGRVSTSEVYYRFLDAITAVARVVRCDVTLKNAELPCGQVMEDSNLVLHAAVTPCTLRPNQISHDILVSSTVRLSQRSVGVRNLVQDIQLLGSAIIDDKADEDIKRGWLVPLVQYKDGGPGAPGMRGPGLGGLGLGGLVVVRVDSEGSHQKDRQDKYRRIGAFLLGSKDTLPIERLPCMQIEIV